MKGFDIKKILTWLTIFACFTARAEFGVSAGAAFNYKADFRTAAQPQGRSVDPDNAAHRTYDDGYIRPDNIPGNPGLTRYYGYDQNQGAIVNNAVGGGTLTLNSAQDIIDAQKSSGEQSEAQPAIEIYYQHDLTENERWNFGLRAALRWQRIELDSTTPYSTTTETISDTYTYSAGALLTDSYSGYPTPSPGYPAINGNPTRDITTSSGTGIRSSRNIDADLFAVDFGPTIALSLTERLRLTASVGGTIAWVHSDFSYEDGAFARGSDTEEDWLFGAYAGADLQYQIGEHWGVFGGAAYTRLEDFDQQTDGRSAELQFDDAYTLRAGIFIR